MPIEVKNDLESFHRFVEEQLKIGGSKLSPEQALSMWRERLDTIESVHRGLDDIEAGRTRPANEVLTDLREELNNT